MKDARLIAIDWGTTAVRAYLVDAAGRIAATREAPLGVQRIGDRQFRKAFTTLLGDWTSLAVPRIASGMIGSRQGWVEAPYVECPAALDALAGHLVWTPQRELAIVPGLIARSHDGVPDVMRGEETQIAGAVDQDRSVLAVLPGTHSKWVCVERGRVVAFRTYLTGELYAVLIANSILGRLAEGPGASEAGPAFGRGVARGLGDEGFAHLIFGARTLALAGELGPHEVHDWLSGVLIGHEIRSARQWATGQGFAERDLSLIGGQALVARYAAALAQAGIDSRSGPPDAAVRGLLRIAERSGVLH